VKDLSGKTMLSCFDFITAKAADEAGIDFVLVGDSIGVKHLGYENASQVTIDDILHHSRAVKRGLTNSELIIDLPQSSCESIDIAIRDSRRCMELVPHSIKIEKWDIELIEAMIQADIPICLDVVMPYVNILRSGYSQEEIFEEIKQTVKQVELIGLKILVLTMVPEEVAKSITESIDVQVFGVGSGKYTNGQVLIVSEMLGLTDFMGEYDYNRKYGDWFAELNETLSKFKTEVQNGEF
jgi:3-methyl-2-oxobutanoate hydroxymethyltransferase